MLSTCVERLCCIRADLVLARSRTKELPHLRALERVHPLLRSHAWFLMFGGSVLQRDVFHCGIDGLRESSRSRDRSLAMSIYAASGSDDDLAP
jgi:hypothetical protein